MTTDPTAPRRPGPRAPDGGLAPVGSRRVEETLTRMMSLFGLLFALQTLPLLVQGWPAEDSPLGLAVVVCVFGVIAVAGLGVLLHQWVRGLFLLTGAVYLGALLSWPLSVTAAWSPDATPWLIALSGVPCGLMIIAGRGPVPVLYLVTVGAVITWLRTTPSAGGLDPLDAARDGGYAVVLGLAMLLVVNAVRRAARAVDEAQGAALGKYANAQIDEATESERVRTDALVHDSVLTTFLSAAAAQTPEGRALASRMAQNALNVLSRATVASHVGPKVAMADLLDRVRRDSDGIGERFEFSVRRVRDHFLPDPVADAVVSAAVQAMTNSVKHAGGPEVHRSVTVEGTESGGVRVSILDHGRGFDPTAVASERLGLRVSIMERMRRVGGEVDLTTAPGRGTEFVLSWPAAARSAPTPTEQIEAVLT